MAAVAHDVEPISPELVLVSPPEVASRAREELPLPPTWEPAPARVVARLPRPLEPLAAAEPEAPPERRGRAWVPWLVTAVVVAAVVVAWLEAPRPAGPSFAPATLRPHAAAPPAAPAEPGPAPAKPAAPATPAKPAPSAKPAPPAKPATTTVVAPAATKPKPAAPPPPQASPGFVPARVWLWPRDRTAKAYDFRLSLDGTVVLHERTTQPRLELPRSFRFHAGTYRWTVRRLPATTGPPLTDSRFTVTPAAAALANR
ncbi:MAG TPA: hypothetical protein VFL60_08650 [Gaiellaceae bacterium]|nr:hypothetical protein [Gaiellaceae bacterium]